MRVFAESNFVLGLALRQEQRAACEHLLELAELRRIDLVLPAYALLEPLETLERRTKEWKELSRRVDEVVGQLRRSDDYKGRAASLDALISSAAETAERDEDQTRQRLLGCANLIPTDAAVLTRAEEYRNAFALRFRDAVMLASIIVRCEAEASPSLFVNVNTKDFRQPDIVTLLSKHACEALWSFDAAANRIDATVPTP